MCSADGSDYAYAEELTPKYRKLATNHCPNHPFYDHNPNTAIAERRTYRLPRSPKYSAAQQTDLSAVGGGVGVTFDGGFIFSAYGGPTYGPVVDFASSAPKVEGDTFDACGGHSSSATAASYHYHVPPVCLLHQLGAAEGAPSPQVGWMLDGFPIYGPLGPGGTKMKTCTVTGGTVGVDICTDDCGGYYGDTGDGYLYRYYFLGAYNDGTCCTTPMDPPFGGGEDYFPFTPICLKGCCPRGMDCTLSGLATCNDDAVDGTAASFNATAVATLEINTGTCAADDMCCDSTVSDTCRPGPPCGECTYEFAGEISRGPQPTLAPTSSMSPSPAPVPAPTPAPTSSMSPVPAPVFAPTPAPNPRPGPPPPPPPRPSTAPTAGAAEAEPTTPIDDTDDDNVSIDMTKVIMAVIGCVVLGIALGMAAACYCNKKKENAQLELTTTRAPAVV